MPNQAEKFGLPQVIIDFRTKSVSAIRRSARGIVAMLIKQETTNVINNYQIQDVTDIPSTFTADNIDLVKKCLLGTPLKVLVYTIPTDDVQATGGTKLAQADALKLLANVKWNYICAPTATEQEQEELASWVKSQRNDKKKTFKAVCAHQAADHEGVINFCTEHIAVPQLDGAGQVTSTKEYTAIEYTARIAGILAGLSLDRSATYFTLSEVASVEKYDDIDSLIDKGQLLLFDELDDMGVKIARACNSLTTFTTDKGEEFRKIKIIEGVDMITDDIRDTFKKYYVGKVINDYDHKMLFIAAIEVYFSGIKGNVLDARAANTIGIDALAQKNFLILHGEDVANMTPQQILEGNTGSNVYLQGNIRLVDAMEDLKIEFTL